MNTMVTRIYRIADLDEATSIGLFNLHARFFENLDPQTFRSDLDEKEWVIIARDGERIVAFCTLLIMHEQVAGKDVDFLFTGDTVVDPEYWQENILAPAIGRFIERQLVLSEPRPVYWFLICKGYRTYLTLPRFFKSFVPDPETEDSAELQPLLDHISTRRYGEHYDKVRGILDFGGSKDFLKAELQAIPESRSSGKFIRFFLERNPGWQRGDELVCLVNVGVENQKPLFRRVTDALEIDCFA